MSSDLTRVHERLDDVMGELTTIRTDVAALVAVCPESRKRIEQHHRTLYGFNDTPGIVGRIHEFRESQKRRERRVGGVLGAIAAVISAMTAAVVSWFSS